MKRDEIVTEIQHILKDADIELTNLEVEEAIEEVYGKAKKELEEAKSRTVKCVLFGVISLLLCAVFHNNVWVYIICSVIILLSVISSVIDTIKINRMNDTISEKLADNIFNRYCNKRIN